MAVKSETMKELMLRDRYDGAQDYDLVLRVVGKLMDSMPPQKLAEHIVHVPKVLYHWRCHADSTAENTASKSYAYEAGKGHWRISVRGEAGKHLWSTVCILDSMIYSMNRTFLRYGRMLGS